MRGHRKVKGRLPRGGRKTLIAVSMVSAWVPTLEAAQFEYGFGTQVESSDNVTRVANEQLARSEVINTTFAGLSYLENTDLFNARIIGSARYNYYYHGVFDNQTTFSLDAFAEGFLFQRTLSWVAADGFRKLQIDPLQPDTPTNRQNSNAWATGPNLYLRFGKVDSAIFEARYGKASVDTLDIDNERQSYAARWAHRLSQRTTLSLNYEYLGVSFENSALYPDLTRQNFYFRTYMYDSRSHLILDVGRTRIDLDGMDSNRNWLFQLSAAMQPEPASSVGIRFRHEYSDTGGALLASAASPQLPTESIMPSLGADVVAAAPFYMAEVDLFYSARGARFPWMLRVFHRDINYENAVNDRQEAGATLETRYAYSSLSTIQLVAGYSIQTYDASEREDRDANVGVTYFYRLTPHVVAGLGARRIQRQSTDPVQEYTDDRFTFAITYGSRPSAR